MFTDFFNDPPQSYLRQTTNSFDTWFLLASDTFHRCDKAYLLVMVSSYKTFHEWEVNFISWFVFMQTRHLAPL